MQTIPFRLETGDKNYGEAYLPQEFQGRMPVILHCHGGGMGCNGGVWGLGETVRGVALQNGMAMVTFDCYAGGKTGGDYGKMTYARWVRNAGDVFDWIQAQPWADPERLGVLGFSCGSTVGLRLAAQDARVKFVCSVGTCVSVHIGMWQGGVDKCFGDHMEALLAGERRNLFGVEFEKDFFIDCLRNGAVHALHDGKITCPVLFLQGLQDNAYRCADARLAYDLMRRKHLPCKLVEYPEGTHGLENVAEQAATDLFEWITEIQV
ncbi:MAG: prolyl oligopeptidase family serine peptidase [Oscillospiraceae bacterium]|jgi:dipeptidyl aminopeptidase/acylaminoacyl peptidase|nr:prolyl oligopeptidase family serine peptidase [Oscillospiraceae bacterium]